MATVLLLARERGPDAITVQAIADGMGITQGAVFRHFPDKEAIWLAVFAWIRESLQRLIEQAEVGARARSPLAALRTLFLAHIAFAATHPGVPRIVFHELQYPGDSPVRTEARAMVAGYRQRIAGLIGAAKAAGELGPRLDPGIAAMLVIGCIQGIVVQSSLGDDPRAVLPTARKAFALLVIGLRGSDLEGAGR